MKRTFILAVILMVAAMGLAGCGGNAPTPVGKPNYKVVSELNDATTQTDTVIITVAQAFTPAEIKAAAESAIAERRERFPHIIIKSFAENADLNGVPLAVSTSTKMGVDHVFNSAMPDAQRIPTH